MNKIEQVKIITNQSDTSSNKMLIVDIDDWGQDRTILIDRDGITVDLTCFELRTITQIVRKYFLKYDAQLHLVHLADVQIGYLKQMLESDYDVVENKTTCLSIKKKS